MLTIEDDERNYCICKKGWGGSASLGEDTNMIGCDGLCKDWYHPSCILMTKFESSMIAANGDNIVWMCKACVKKLAGQRTKLAASTME